jgi:alkylhydroperoxidase/carboxymuconolactone decarboxylase family protein YurZ
MEAFITRFHRLRNPTMADSDAPVLDLLAQMTADSLAASTLDPQTLMLVRIAALVAVDAQPVSYSLNIGAAADVGLDAESIRGVLTAIAPIVGTARVAAATGNIVQALAVEIEAAVEALAELEAEDEE